MGRNETQAFSTALKSWEYAFGRGTNVRAAHDFRPLYFQREVEH